MKATGFNHVTIRVSDLSRSLLFYESLLGMKLVHRGRLDVYLEWGSAWVCLIERSCESSEKPGYGVDHIAFSIADEDFHDAACKLQQAGVPIVRGPLERGGGYSINFLDPDGTELELFTGSLAERMKGWS
ncbi:Fos family putative thiol transferase [Paenibacillus oleatilyticus]|uniref:Fos family putative thiol transferase n=1 Tax=Paenibacillus oleatilyticus TaxID=2594886 RepID=UPI001C1F237B|nr:Fos family putative thiol transferase [Paenibacillus oleatilyticus]MBU7318689.1 Fos family putative thiol transferase [Paenibacillus oleatilyticus]